MTPYDQKLAINIFGSFSTENLRWLLTHLETNTLTKRSVRYVLSLRK